VNFAHPKVIWISLVLLPLLGLFLWATWRKRQALVRQFVQHKTLARQTLGVSSAFQKLRRIILFVAVVLVLLAIAGPQWGFTWEEATQRGRDIIVAIDTSRSMLAEDLQPSRLARAKLAALDLLQLGKFDRFGLIAFSGTAFLQCPLTFDDEAFRQNVQLLQPGIIPQGGTALSQAIQAARDAFAGDTDDNHRILVLFTDGEDHEAGILETVQRAANDRIKIFTVGVGTPGGELLRTRDERGATAYIKDDEGNVVKSRLNEQLLNDIAEKTGGLYVPLQGGNAMEILYQKGLAPLPTSDRTTKLTKRFREQFYWPLITAIALLILEVFVPEQKRTPRPKAEPNATGTLPAAAALIMLLALAPQSTAGPAKAQRYYEAGEYKSALSEYQELIAKNPADARLHYNAGAAAYKANKFDEAIKEFQASTGSNDIDLQQQSFYNLGNAEFRLGEGTSNPQERMAVWEQAVQHYDAALKLNPNDKDGEFNRDLVSRKLDELKQQQKQEQKKNNNQDNKDENRQDKDDASKDEHKQDNKDQQNKDDHSKPQEPKEDNSSQQEQQKKEEEKKQQQQNQQEKQDEQQDKQSQAKQGGQKESDNQKPEEDAGQYAQLGKMTPAQAKQLLDAQRDEEKALIFIPQERKSDARARSIKDW